MIDDALAKSPNVQSLMPSNILLKMNHVCVCFIAFKELGRLILDVGLLLAHHCDKFGS